MKIHKGDTVQIMIGKDRGKSGKIGLVDVKNQKVLLPGFNLYKKHKKPTRQGEKGETISVARMMPVANVQLLCGSCGRPTRVGYKLEGLNKNRICKKCKAVI